MSHLPAITSCRIFPCPGALLCKCAASGLFFLTLSAPVGRQSLPDPLCPAGLVPTLPQPSQAGPAAVAAAMASFPWLSKTPATPQQCLGPRQQGDRCAAGTPCCPKQHQQVGNNPSEPQKSLLEASHHQALLCPSHSLSQQSHSPGLHHQQPQELHLCFPPEPLPLTLQAPAGIMPLEEAGDRKPP